MSTALTPLTATAQDEAPYPDVPADAYYAAPVRTLTGDGIFASTLCDDGFCPDEPLDRMTMAVWTVRLLDGADPLAVTQTRFDDVDPNGFHAPFIERMAELGVTSGCGDGSGFCPDRSVTRAQMAVFLSRAYDLPHGPDPGFSDVPADAWYAADVARLAASGVTEGCGDRTVFCPDRPTTRGEMATFLARSLSLGSLWVWLDSLAPDAVRESFDAKITFSEAVTGLAVDDIDVSNGSAVGLSGSAHAYTVEIEPAANGVVVVMVPADAVRDDRGRSNQASEPLIQANGSRSDMVGIDTWDRSAVHDAYTTEFGRTEPDWDYTGDVDGCIAGTTGQPFRDSVFQRLNWYRQMAGLGTVQEDPASSAGAQHTALMMLAEGRLSHEPGSGWACYNDTGRRYAEANLGIGTAGLAGIDGYMQDPGGQNTEVGHRRWILYPQTMEMGTGNARRGREANALWPRDDNTFASRPRVREPRGFVAWPPSGHVPPETVWGRWSLSLGGADFSGASVTMSDGDGPVATEVIHRSAAPRPNSRSAPEQAIVWAVAGDTNSDLLRAPSGPDHCYTVNITGVRIAGAAPQPYEYTTCVLGEPSVPPPPDHATRTGGVDDIPGPEQDATEDDTPATPTSTIHSFKAVTAGDSHTCGLRTDDTITCWGDNGDGRSLAPGESFKAVSAGNLHTCGLRSDDTVTCWGANYEAHRYTGQTNAPGGTFKAVTAGGAHSCGLRTDDTITCWGYNRHGQTTAPSGSFKAVSAGNLHSCGLRSDNTITCWGNDEHGQANAPDGTFKAVVAGGSGIRWSLNRRNSWAGPTHSCGLRTDNTITCWGSNEDGESDAPGGSFEAVTAGGSHTCGLRSDGTITCWGYNGHGQTNAPDAAFKAVSAGSLHTCALRSDDTITCWGLNQWGQADAPGGSLKAVTVRGLTAFGAVTSVCGLRSDDTITCWRNNKHHPPSGTFKTVAAGNRHSCALRSDDTLQCWGRGKFKGDGSTWNGMWYAINYSGNGARVNPYTSLKAVTTDGRDHYGHTCVIRYDDTVRCWGDNTFGQAVPPDGTFKSIDASPYQTCGIRSDNTMACWPGNANIPGSFEAVAVGFGHRCGLRSDSSVTCWGTYYDGNTNRPFVAPDGTFKAIAADNDHACGLRTDDTITCWGSNYDTTHSVYIGQADPPSGTFKAVTASNQHSCGLRSDNTITCWGSNEHGHTDAPSGNFKAVTGGRGHFCGLRSDDTITCWGNNRSGQADAPGGRFKAIDANSGDDACALRSDGTVKCWGTSFEYYGLDQPDGTLKAVTVGRDHTCGLRTDNTIICWGSYNDWSDTSDTGAPASRPSGAPDGHFKEIASGRDQTCGLRTDNTITCWGYFHSWDEGDRTSQPAFAPGGSFKTVTAGSSHSCGLRSDNSITCWGSNGDGQTDAPSGNFKAITAGSSHSCGLRTDNTITCWGSNGDGRATAPSGKFKAVDAGTDTTCALSSDDVILCWGALSLRVYASPASES